MEVVACYAHEDWGTALTMRPFFYLIIVRIFLKPEKGQTSRLLPRINIYICAHGKHNTAICRRSRPFPCRQSIHLSRLTPALQWENVRQEGISFLRTLPGSKEISPMSSIVLFRPLKDEFFTLSTKEADVVHETFGPPATESAAGSSGSQPLA